MHTRWRSSVAWQHQSSPGQDPEDVEECRPRVCDWRAPCPEADASCENRIIIR